MVAAALGAAEWRAARRRQLAVAAVAAMVALPLLLLPVYRARNTRLKREAQLASQVMATIQDQAGAGGVGRIVLHDAPATHPSLADAFGNSLPLALQLLVPVDRRPEVEIAGDATRIPWGDPSAIEFRMQEGRLVRKGEGTAR
jgi:hypothetical protein